MSGCTVRHLKSLAQKKRGTTSPLFIGPQWTEWTASLYLWVHITQNLSLSCPINTVVKKAWQGLYHLGPLNAF